MYINLKRFLELRRKARTDIWWLAKILKYNEMVEFHTKYHDIALKMLHDSKNPYCAIYLPRGWFKTSLFTITDTIRDVLIDPETRQLLISYTGDNVKGMLGELQNQFIANEDIRFLFPDICPDNTSKPETGIWRSDSIVVKRRRSWKEGTVDALGADQNPVSRHYNKIRLDDVVVDKNTRDNVQMEKTVQFIRNIYPLQLLHTQSRINVVGTTWVNDDAHCQIAEGRLLAPNGKKFRILKLAAEYRNENGRYATWPEIFSIEKLDGLKISMGRNYSALMLNDPEDEENQLWTRKMIEEYDTLPEDREYYFYGGLDPSISERDSKRNSDTAVGVIAIDNKNELWVVDYELSRGVSKINQQIFNYFLKYKDWNGERRFKYFSIEAILFQKLLARDLRREMQEKGIWIPIYEDHPIASKESRIMILDGLIQNKAFHVRHDMDELKTQIARFRRPGVKNDILDMIAQAYKVSLFKTVTQEKESGKTEIARYARIASERRKRWENGQRNVAYLGQLR